MHMKFWFSPDLGEFLIQGFEVNSTTGCWKKEQLFCIICAIEINGFGSACLEKEGNQDRRTTFVATCFGLGSIAVLLELLKFWRTKVKHKSALKQSLNAQIGGSETSALLSGSRLRGNLERVFNITFEVVMYFTQESFNWIVMLAVMGYNGYIFLSVLAGAGLGYALFGESVANAKIQNVKMKAAMMSCGDCQVKEEEETDENDPGQSDPPTDSQAIPSISGSISRTVLVHCDP